MTCCCRNTINFPLFVRLVGGKLLFNKLLTLFSRQLNQIKTRSKRSSAAIRRHTYIQIAVSDGYKTCTSKLSTRRRHFHLATVNLRPTLDFDFSLLSKWAYFVELCFDGVFSFFNSNKSLYLPSCDIRVVIVVIFIVYLVCDYSFTHALLKLFNNRCLIF